MKKFLTIVRWVVGLLFIFSGLIKVNDPLGLCYKMQEFFDVWGWTRLYNVSLLLAIVMNTFEVILGIALIIGQQMKIVSRALTLLMVFFTFLTGYALFSGKIKTCGCLGDCIPLLAGQSFAKDIVLLVLVLFIMMNYKKIHPYIGSIPAFSIIMASVMGLALVQQYVLDHLPFMDCLPYKKGNNIVELMKKPSGAIDDQYNYVFRYKKDGKVIEYPQDKLPENLDSSYEFVDRKDVLVKKGNGLTAKITGFMLQTMSGNDTTMAILNHHGEYVLVLAKDLKFENHWKQQFEAFVQEAKQKNVPVLLVTADSEHAIGLFKDVTILKCDGTIIKTAARVNPTYFLMQQGTILYKRSYKDIDGFLE